MTTRALWHPAHLHTGTFRAPVALHRLTGLAGRMQATLGTWRHRARDRARLAALDDRMLKDIGITRTDAIFLSSRPFWRE